MKMTRLIMNEISSKVKIEIKKDVAVLKRQMELSSRIVVHGGYLLHRVYWMGDMFEDIIGCYQNYVNSNYDTAMVILDG